ncbi:putative proline hydroxylase [Encephalitozoon romaleae SJ-2008]|uniref:Proline hydroxylase n=1 Tax=Encephalitozoon romaleae (strain SJ-2008) TaxID=1178016 RepID=I7AF57_ENCRO|nr:putative proline hydroxylase [Encephalitozoon romaleae SJ-2008]AFN83315.1 putative proline hydroxylase [Encephalitozoon romaleae SJ-2008]
MKRYERPFLHFVKDDFLSPSDVEAIRDVHGRCAFQELHTDLFRFLQTGELKEREDLAFFKSSLMKVFEEIGDERGGWIDLFGSYYRKGDYLLCHDDKTGSRRFAFSYYLEDYDSGELILYENDCMTVSKRVEVKANRLVVFEVSDISFHEVGYCEKDGRRAFTGWLNFAGIKHDGGSRSMDVLGITGYETFPLEVDFRESSFVFFPGVEYDFECVSRSVEGPFYLRRVERIEISNPLVPTMEGWKLKDGGFYHFRVGDYILLNDRCNTVEGNVCDLFFIEGEEAACCDNSEVFKDPINPVKYLDEEGRFVCGLPITKGMFAIKRDGFSLFVERCNKEFFLAHFIYVQEG